MPTQAFLSSFNPLLDDDGNPLPGGKLYFLTPGTADFKSVFADAESTVELEQPTILDGTGRRTIFLSGDYDLEIYDKDDASIRSIPNINPDVAGAQTGINLVDNGSFELNTNGDGKTPDNWDLIEETGSTVALDPDSAVGAQAICFTSIGNGGGNITNTNFFEVAGGDVLTIAFWLKSSVVDVRNLVQLIWYDSGQSQISTSTVYDESLANPTSWTQQIATITAPANARFGKIRFYGAHPSDSTPGQTCYDGVEVISSSIGSSFLSGTKMIFCQESEPAGWTYDAEDEDRLLMFGDYNGGTEAGSWVATGLTVNLYHRHDDGSLAVVLPQQSSVAGPAGVGFAGPGTYQVNGFTDYALSNNTPINSNGGWRPNHRVVKCGTKD